MLANSTMYSLSSLLASGNVREELGELLLGIPIILLALSMHELAHGYVAYKCGDGTAKALGRLTLNPLKHLDPIGAVCMLLIGFGWAKPVPVNMRYFRKPKRDLVLVSLAGPLTNFLLAVVFALLRFAFLLTLEFITLPESAGTALMVIHIILLKGITLNLGLGLFNLIPLPPLDGSKILMCLLPSNTAAKYAKVERYSRFILLGIIAISWYAPIVSTILFFPLNLAMMALSTPLIHGLDAIIDLIVKLIG